jgi:rhomboid protease GluP
MSNPRMCPHCRAFIDPKARVCPYCDNEVGKPAWRQEQSTPALRGLIPASHFTTFIILALNFGVFAATLILSMKLSGGASMLDIPGEVLLAFGAKQRIYIINGQWWRLVTAGFLHAGVFHILMNSWVLFDLGSQAEQVFGTARYLVIYLLSSVCGFYVSLLLSPATLSIGASAAACGLIGAMLAFGYRSGSRFIWSFYLRWIAMIAVIGLLPGFNIDNAAHFGGFAAGFAVAYLAGTASSSRSIETIWNVAAGACVAVVAICFVMAYLTLSRALSF